MKRAVCRACFFKIIKWRITIWPFGTHAKKNIKDSDKRFVDPFIGN